MKLLNRTRKPIAPESRHLMNVSLIALSLAGAYALLKSILIPATHSVNPHVLFRTGHSASKQDQYVTFLLKDDYLPGGSSHLVKRLGCIAGQYLMREANQFYCDGKQIALVMLRDSDGKSLPQFHYAGIIPVGKAFAVGDTINSYDSRYWGFISIADTERLVPLI